MYTKLITYGNYTVMAWHDGRRLPAKFYKVGRLGDNYVSSDIHYSQAAALEQAKRLHKVHSGSKSIQLVKVGH